MSIPTLEIGSDIKFTEIRLSYSLEPEKKYYHSFLELNVNMNMNINLFLIIGAGQ